MTSSRRSLSPLSLSPHVLSTRLAITPARRRGPAGRAAPPARASPPSRGARRARRRPPCRRRRPGRSAPAPCPASAGITVAPTGTIAWRRLLSAIGRPQLGEQVADHVGDGVVEHAARRPSRRRSPRGSRRRASDRARRRRSRRRRRRASSAAPRCRPTLSPTLTCSQRGDAVGRQLLADPRRVGVDDLAEQQLGADGHDVTSHAQTTDTSEEHGACPSGASARSTGRR